jgi:hypothetical protein
MRRTFGAHCGWQYYLLLIQSVSSFLLATRFVAINGWHDRDGEDALALLPDSRRHHTRAEDGSFSAC